MKYFKNPKKYPLTITILISTLVFSVMGYLGKRSIYASYPIDFIKTPQLAAVFEAMNDDIFPWNLKGYTNIKTVSISTDTVYAPLDDTVKTAEENSLSGEEVDGSNKAQENQPPTGIKESNTQEASDNVTKGTAKPGTAKPGTAKPGTAEPGTTKPGTANPGAAEPGTTKSDAAYTDETDSVQDNETGSEQDTYQFETVKESYFDDALFIGDSRTVGLSEYSGWKNPTYFADVGLTIYDVFDKKIAEVNGKKYTIDKALEKKQFNKIYIMLGINELGTGNTKIFIKEYKEVIEKIQKLQPEAIIFVEGIMNVSKKKSDSDPIFNNKNIKDKNDHLALLADNKNIFYIDVNEAITDKTGGIPQEYTFDNIHLKAAYYNIWTKFLMKHGIVKEG
ncbi:GDSL-type esterase/lipase family protein [Anaerocolumna sp. AGMB13025]|uniref:GDSL-type esterase/lipase family protein n=1 Tax=Anaerocolumna sp. AGMB13025 TaxID=3039116 RepID=UPI00241E18FC|nr:GDSL-type esterase/lipase family protein [Anaerocolumna sp. AGMB13025]WFR55740.1 GDSL-type esterase/lipase family protein [Anaerocolumna sp. AGMB13025]